MRIVTHTPRVYVEEWEVSGVPDTMTDREVLDLLETGVGPGRAVRTASSMHDTGVPFLYARGEDDLEAFGRRLREATAAREMAMDAGRSAAVAAMDAGTASERAVSVAFGVDRETVRAWRGKGRERTA